tara:strand:- start:1911 stop:2096 length:186 start_codon:yes stop_codon:yes gene_type:complete
MAKAHFIAAHEELVGEYLDQNPNVTEAQAYERTADKAHARMVANLADRVDHLRQLRKDGML